jgi:hypothetical protein
MFGGELWPVIRFTPIHQQQQLLDQQIPEDFGLQHVEDRIIGKRHRDRNAFAPGPGVRRAVRRHRFPSVEIGGMRARS